MEWKHFFDKNKKIILIIFIIFALIFIIASFLIYDRNKTRKEKLEKNIEAENYKKDLSKELKENIPDKGNMIFIDFYKYENKNKDILPLLKQEKFRKSLYYVLNRKDITQNENNLKPLSVLFTKTFFTDNKKCFPKPFLPHNEKSMEIYEDLDLKNYGFNENKALKCLEESWNQLTPEEQKQNYVLRFKINEDDIKHINNSVKEKIVEQINNLFKKFLEEKKYDLNKLKIEIVENEFDMQLFMTPVINEHNKEDYYLNLIEIILKYDENSKIDINLSHIKKYLEEQKHKGKTILENKSNLGIQNLLNNKKPFNSQSIFEGTIDEFYIYMGDNIVQLFPSFGVDHQSKIEESLEIKELKQKTFEEIFEKVLCLLHKEMLQIPVCVYNTENVN